MKIPNSCHHQIKPIQVEQRFLLGINYASIIVGTLVQEPPLYSDLSKTTYKWSK